MKPLKELINVMIVDDDNIVRIGLKTILNKEPDINIIGEASSGENALKIVNKLRPDIVLMDIKMTGINGIETTRRMVKYIPDIKIIAITAYWGYPYPVKSIQSGASGFLSKDCDSEELIDAIRLVNTGKRYFSKKMVDNINMYEED